MRTIGEWFGRIITFFSQYFMILNVWELLRTLAEIAIMAFIIYKIIQLVIDTRAWQLLKGVLILLLVAWVAELVKFETISLILKNAVTVLAFALVVIFQDELKKILETLGNSNLKNIFNDKTNGNNIESERIINEIVKAAVNLSSINTGALIVMERNIKLGEILATGIPIDSYVSAELIEQIFVPNTPLHDGAVVVRGNKIMAATCILPLTANVNLSKELGTRHRAAIGMTEISDSIVVVVSEETGKISVTMEGKIRRGFDKDSLTNFLKNSMMKEDEPLKKKLFFKKRGDTK